MVMDPDSLLSEYPKTSMLPIVTLKRQLRFYLDLNNMTASQLSRKAHVPKQSLSGWIAGSKPRDVSQVKKVADALGISLDNLLFGNGREVVPQRSSDLDELLGDNWLGGVFEIRFRRLRK